MMAIQVVEGKPADGMRLNSLNLTKWKLESEFSGVPFDTQSALDDRFFDAAVYSEYLAIASEFDK